MDQENNGVPEPIDFARLRHMQAELRAQRDRFAVVRNNRDRLYNEYSQIITHLNYVLRELKIRAGAV
jgi:hypothetical protein